jgi:hypothetical protein
VPRLQGSGLYDLKPDRCVVFHQIDSYLNMMEDQEPKSPSGCIRILGDFWLSISMRVGVTGMIAQKWLLYPIPVRMT